MFFINYNSSSHFMTYTRSTLLNETPCMKPFNLVLVMFTFRKEITDLHNAINVVYLKNYSTFHNYFFELIKVFQYIISCALFGSYFYDEIDIHVITTRYVNPLYLFDSFTNKYEMECRFKKDNVCLQMLIPKWIKEIMYNLWTFFS